MTAKQRDSPKELIGGSEEESSCEEKQLKLQCNSAISDTSLSSSTSFHQRFDLGQLKARLPELICFHSIQRYLQQHHNGVSGNAAVGARDHAQAVLNAHTNSSSASSAGTAAEAATAAAGNSSSSSFYLHNILGCTFSNPFTGSSTKLSKESSTKDETPLQKFYRHQQQQRKMPGFRGKSGWCGCFQVSGDHHIASVVPCKLAACC